MYNPALGRTWQIDLMLELYYDLSPYSWVANNPLRHIDPTGMVIDDYFTEDGAFLGSDEAETDNVRIISQEEWNANKTENEDGSESIDHEIGSKKPTSLSESSITQESELKVYDHYNTTDLPLSAMESDKAGMQLSVDHEKKSVTGIKVKLEANRRQKISDHANEITSLFEHEGRHIDDFNTVGYDAFYGAGKQEFERSAYGAQMNSSTFGKTRKAFQKAVRISAEKIGGIVLPPVVKQIKTIKL